MLPIGAPSSGTSRRAPGRRYVDPRTATIVARAMRSPLADRDSIACQHVGDLAHASMVAQAAGERRTGTGRFTRLPGVDSTAGDGSDLQLPRGPGAAASPSEPTGDRARGGGVLAAVRARVVLPVGDRQRASQHGAGRARRRAGSDHRHLVGQRRRSDRLGPARRRLRDRRRITSRRQIGPRARARQRCRDARRSSMPARDSSAASRRRSIFVDGPAAAPGVVSVASTAEIWGAAVAGPSGTCYLLRFATGRASPTGPASGASARATQRSPLATRRW